MELYVGGRNRKPLFQITGSRICDIILLSGDQIQVPSGWVHMMYILQSRVSSMHGTCIPCYAVSIVPRGNHVLYLINHKDEKRGEMAMIISIIPG
jgi:hypothetical protein